MLYSGAKGTMTPNNRLTDTYNISSPTPRQQPTVTQETSRIPSTSNWKGARSRAMSADEDLHRHASTTSTGRALLLAV